MKNRLIQKIFALLGFSAMATGCESIDDIIGGQVCMYGCPNADYVFNAEASDKDSNEPIEGIRVAVVERGERQYWDSETGMATYEPYCDTLAVGTTQADGKLQLSYNGFPTNKHEVVFDDVDGAENGGNYASAAVVVTTENDDYAEKGDVWYSGTATHDVVVKLSKKSE